METGRALAALGFLRMKDPFDCISHFIGALCSCAGLALLIKWSYGDRWKVFAFSVYGASLIFLYITSALYHWLILPPRGGDILRRLDHIAIGVLIAGTYTPICLITLYGSWGWTILAVIWGLAGVNLMQKIFFQHMPRRFIALQHLAMGWIIIIAIVPLLERLPLMGFIWILGGGIAYSLGAAIYALKWPDLFPGAIGFHGIFHLFCLAGSFLHYLCMVWYVLPQK